MNRTLVFSVILLLLGAGSVRAGGEIHGTVTTSRGARLTGPIRWDKNEVAWDDFLDAEKIDRVKRRERNTRISLFGREILTWLPGESWLSSQFSIPFGQIRSIEKMGGRRARLRLKNGDVVKVESSGSDLGSDMRGLVIQDRKEGKVDLKWRDVERVEFSQGPGPGIDADRLYGTVETRKGEFRGFIVWDRDEAIVTDILDGEEGGDDREIAFGEIAEIRRRDGRSCRVGLKSGAALTLSGTNDVDSDNRGIDVTVEGIGRIEIGWNEFQRVVFTAPPPSPRYERYDGGRRIRGTVTTAGGKIMRGRIVWDEDEEYLWETLDGKSDGVDHAILFENIRSIERVSRESAEVLLKSGAAIVLEGSNDVNLENKGIRILPDAGEEVTVGWGEFQKVEFE